MQWPFNTSCDGSGTEALLCIQSNGAPLHSIAQQGTALTVQNRADEGLGVLVDLLLGAAGCKHAVVLELLAHAAAWVVQRQLTILAQLCAAYMRVFQLDIFP